MPARHTLAKKLRGTQHRGSIPTLVQFRYPKGESRQEHQRSTTIRRRMLPSARRFRLRRYTSSFFTPMGDEMYYRYQQSLIDESINTLGALLRRAAAKP